MGKVLTGDANGIAGGASLSVKSAKSVLATNEVINNGSVSSIALAFNSNGGFTDPAGGNAAGTSVTIAADQSGTCLLAAQGTCQLSSAFSDTKYFRFNIRKGDTVILSTTMLTNFNNINDIQRTQTASTVVKQNAGDNMNMFHLSKVE